MSELCGDNNKKQIINKWIGGWMDEMEGTDLHTIFLQVLRLNFLLSKKSLNFLINKLN
jgi:hypothetical protein